MKTVNNLGALFHDIVLWYIPVWQSSCWGIQDGLICLLYSRLCMFLVCLSVCALVYVPLCAKCWYMMVEHGIF